MVFYSFNILLEMIEKRVLQLESKIRKKPKNVEEELKTLDQIKNDILNIGDNEIIPNLTSDQFTELLRFNGNREVNQDELVLIQQLYKV